LRVLADTPAFRSEPGRRYGGSTLESASDVRQLVATLLEFRGGDGFPPVWQANTIVAAPDYPKLLPPTFVADPLPLQEPDAASARWRRPGLREAVDDVCRSGLWWPELHGLHHLPEHAWLTALRRGSADARRAHDQGSPICEAVEASGEYDPSEPQPTRRRNLELAIERFRMRFGRAPTSFCPPDYRWGPSLELDLEQLGPTTLQGFAEHAGERLPRVRRLLLRYRWPNRRGAMFYLPPRNAFEPSKAEARGMAALVRTARESARAAWGRGQPAIISTHRLNYAHLRPAHSAAGLAALRDLLKGLVEDGAVFLVDAEVRQLEERAWSVRAVGDRAAIVRFHGVPRQPIRFPVPAGVTGARIREGHATGEADVAVDRGEVVARLNVGEFLLGWERGFEREGASALAAPQSAVDS